MLISILKELANISCRHCFRRDTYTVQSPDREILEYFFPKCYLNSAGAKEYQSGRTQDESGVGADEGVALLESIGVAFVVPSGFFEDPGFTATGWATPFFCFLLAIILLAIIIPLSFEGRLRGCSTLTGAPCDPSFSKHFKYINSGAVVRSGVTVRFGRFFRFEVLSADSLLVTSVGLPVAAATATAAASSVGKFSGRSNSLAHRSYLLAASSWVSKYPRCVRAELILICAT